jgi:endonuclease G, mitochondrial
VIKSALRSVAALALLAAPAPLLADDAEVHTLHCLYGCPTGAAETNDLVVREIYTLSSNDLTKFADWVAYRVGRDTVGPSQSRGWAADPWLAPDETLEEEDYEGARAALDTDRGHQAPLAALSGTPHWPQTNIFSNITPQDKDLNQGAWERLENRERTFVAASGQSLFVLTGPLYERDMAPLPEADEAHRVPSGYWKVLVTEDGRLSSFIFDQRTARNTRYCTGRDSLAEVERRAMLRLFPRLAQRNFRSLDADLGCP